MSSNVGDVSFGDELGHETVPEMTSAVTFLFLKNKVASAWNLNVPVFELSIATNACFVFAPFGYSTTWFGSLRFLSTTDLTPQPPF